MPTELHTCRWVVEKRPKVLADAAKLTDEYDNLCKPFKFDQAKSPTSDNKTFPATTDKHIGRGNSGRISRIREQTLSL